jgi:hypothetical protein
MRWIGFPIRLLIVCIATGIVLFILPLVYFFELLFLPKDVASTFFDFSDFKYTAKRVVHDFYHWVVQ